MRISDWSSDVCSSDLLGAHVVQVAADAVAGADDIARDRLVLGDERLGVAAQVDVDVAALDALDDAGHPLADAILPLVHDLTPLALAPALHDHPLGGLGCDAPEIQLAAPPLDAATLARPRVGQ